MSGTPEADTVGAWLLPASGDPPAIPGSTTAPIEVERPRRGTVLAFDYGDKRMGVAVGEIELGLAHPLETVVAGSEAQRMAAAERLVGEWSPALLVVGMPLHMDGTEQEMSLRARRFARRLQARFHVPAVLVDERLTSFTAKEALFESGVRGRRQRGRLDKMAAQQILQAYLDGSPGIDPLAYDRRAPAASAGGGKNGTA